MAELKALGLCLRWTLLGLLVAVLVAFAAALQRLFPAVSALAGLGLLRTLALPLASLALELAVLAGVPLGFALGALRAAPRARQLLALLAVPALLAAGVLALSRQVDLKDESPGSVVERLISAARESCGSGARDVDVPIVKVRVRCSEGRLVGDAPVGRGTFSASELVPSADLSRLALSNFELSLAPGKTRPALRVHATQARIRGLRPWGRARTEPALRFGATWLATVLASAAAALLIIGKGWPRALFVGLGAGLGAALASLELDRVPGAWGLLVLPAAGVAAAVCSQLLWDLTDELVAHFRTLRLRRRRAIARAAGRW